MHAGNLPSGCGSQIARWGWKHEPEAHQWRKLSCVKTSLPIERVERSSLLWQGMHETNLSETNEYGSHATSPTRASNTATTPRWYTCATW